MSSRSSSRGRRGLQSWTQRWITSSASGIESLQKLSPLSSFDPSIPWTFLAFHFPNFVPSWRSSLVLTPSVTNIVNLGQFSRDHCWLMSSAAFNLKESRLTLVEPVIMAASYSSQFWQKRTLVHQKFLTKGTKIWARNKSIHPHCCWPRNTKARNFAPKSLIEWSVLRKGFEMFQKFLGRPQTIGPKTIRKARNLGPKSVYYLKCWIPWPQTIGC